MKSHKLSNNPLESNVQSNLKSESTTENKDPFWTSFPIPTRYSPEDVSSNHDEYLYGNLKK